MAVEQILIAVDVHRALMGVVGTAFVAFNFRFGGIVAE
jgi:hypothetical protein